MKTVKLRLILVIKLEPIVHPVKQHLPGEPQSPDPPEALYAVTEKLQHPLVIRTGVTCTKDGRWAVYVSVPKKTKVPLPELEAQCGGFPVVYEAEPDEPLQPM